ncbi:hypothetical protein BpHYR1_032506 [Brachionus plicatilis]|uniref:Uncharacterized protein n=1 Tax=Brachionus plicatilis TaxID=10195 RepID=A0A3M7Q5J4_BRAPC|nr:hypothetical protein BpHYR1_032506 [Brachionus plicatilis]
MKKIKIKTNFFPHLDLAKIIAIEFKLNNIRNDFYSLVSYLLSFSHNVNPLAFTDIQKFTDLLLGHRQIFRIWTLCLAAGKTHSKPHFQDCIHLNKGVECHSLDQLLSNKYKFQTIFTNDIHESFKILILLKTLLDAYHLENT